MKSFVILSFFFSIYYSKSVFSQIHCEGSNLVNSFDQIIRKFDFKPDCENASENRNGNFICAPNGIHSVLINIWGKELKHFTFMSDCKESLKINVDGLICSTNELRYHLISDQTGILAHYTFEADCRDTLKFSKNGFICIDSKENTTLRNLVSRKDIFSFSSSSDCKNALNQTSAQFICINKNNVYQLVDTRKGQIRSKKFNSEHECLQAAPEESTTSKYKEDQNSKQN
ncbi:MAG: hypothetical protein K1X29_10395 [Bdellovibrionales bacterium]|nr:hypothetical protein [Bdellovibrionales bacterium]